MPHHVYANSNEIASKSSDGKSVACFPDVCFSPPTPPATGVPIPYANTCLAKNITNGSKTVIIAGSEIALENHSYFSTSTGDTPATKLLKKGIRSRAINGRGYFRTWSQNVKVEGMGVCRHMDLVTHNHSKPTNTGTNRFMSRANTKKACARNNKRMANNCKEKSKDKQKTDRKNKNKFLTLIKNVPSMMDDKAKKAYGYRRNKDNSWIEDYCDGLWVKPSMGATGQLVKLKKEMEDLLSLGQVGIRKQALVQLISLAYQNLSLSYLFTELAVLGTKAAIKNLVGLAAGTSGIGLTVTAGMGAWTVADMVSTANNLAQKLNTPEARQLQQLITNPKETHKQLKQQLQNYKESPTKFVADIMTAKANLSPCIRSRRCWLVPYSETGAKKAAESGQGCCPGQTGHHIMPDAMFKGACSDYEYRSAPTICLEGSNNSHGSHGKAHSALERIIKKYKKDTGKTDISYSEALDKCVEAILEVAPHCDPKCLKGQLDEHHDVCKGKRLNAVSGK